MNATTPPTLSKVTRPGVGRRSGSRRNPEIGDRGPHFSQNHRKSRLRPDPTLNRRNPLTSRRLNQKDPRPEAAGVTYYQYRWYDPLTGRWPSRDPIGEESFVVKLKLGNSDILDSFGHFGKSSGLMLTITEAGRNRISTQITKSVTEIDELLGGYTFVSNDSVTRLDVFGLTLYACLTPTMGGNATHAFIYSSQLGIKKGQWGMHGCSGTALPDGNGGGKVRPDLKNCRVINVPSGMTEKEAFEKVKEWDGWHKGVWCPWKNDCHNQLEDAVKAAGLVWPYLPGGRLIQPGDPCCQFDPKGPNPLDLP